MRDCTNDKSSIPSKVSGDEVDTSPSAKSAKTGKLITRQKSVAIAEMGGEKQAESRHSHCYGRFFSFSISYFYLFSFPLPPSL